MDKDKRWNKARFTGLYVIYQKLFKALLLNSGKTQKVGLQPSRYTYWDFK